MTRATTSGRVVRTRTEDVERCLALSGKGAPGAADLERAIEAVMGAAEELRSLKRRGGHEFTPPDPEVRLRAPRPGARGGAGWTVFVRVPEFVTARDARAAALEAAERLAEAKNIRLSPVDLEPHAPAPRAHRERQPSQIRRRRTGPQHRAREQRR